LTGRGQGVGLGRAGRNRGLVGRPRIPRCTRFDPKAKYFKPVGVPLTDIKDVVLQADELEAIKLHDYDGLDQIKAAGKMKISQPTLARTLAKAYQKIAKALIEGHALKLVD
jgi:predicted DNA-binding protein (UPF0251 family)